MSKVIVFRSKCGAHVVDNGKTRIKFRNHIYRASKEVEIAFLRERASRPASHIREMLPEQQVQVVPVVTAAVVPIAPPVKPEPEVAAEPELTPAQKGVITRKANAAAKDELKQ